jgi:hypothetical protein
MTKVYAPVRDFSGPGAGGVIFKDGVAEITSEPLLSYFRAAGFGIDRPAPLPGVDEHLRNADARDYAAPIMVGTPLRDAAVDPHPDDFLAPTNAGEADPHGPLVVAPGIHAVGPKPIAAGPVPGETKAQDIRETALAQAVLVEDQPATIVANPFLPSEEGGAGLGEQQAEAQAAANAASPRKAPPNRRSTSRSTTRR